jgi:carbamoyl-phosphate synthase large subunit
LLKIVDLFRQKMERLCIPMPESGMACQLDEALKIAEQIGYPVMVRPSFVRAAGEWK